ncbi:MAG TPA: DUF2784 domain-containing protein [Steroidobacteraceae bacterium]|jgi:hypothetical protein
MLYRFLADVVLVVHLLFVLFVAVGALVLLRWPRLVWIHLPTVLWGAYIELSGRVCPLTPLEVRLRQLGGEAGYEGGFIDHYITAWLYPSGLTRGMQIGLAVGVFVVNAALYWWVFLGRRRKRSSPEGQ